MRRWFAIANLVVAGLLSSGCGGSGSATANAPADTQEHTPSVATVKSWPVAWCKAQPGMTRAQMRALMGPPTSEFDLASGNPQMSWDFAEYQFNAFMDVNDHVRQLDVNDIELSASEKAAIHCASTRR